MQLRLTLNFSTHLKARREAGSSSYLFLCKAAQHMNRRKSASTFVKADSKLAYIPAAAQRPSEHQPRTSVSTSMINRVCFKYIFGTLVDAVKPSPLHLQRLPDRKGNEQWIRFLKR